MTKEIWIDVVENMVDEYMELTGVDWNRAYDGSRVIDCMSDFGTDYRDAEIVDCWQPLPEPPENDG